MEIAVLDGRIDVTPYNIRALSPEDSWGVAGTFYTGDADLIADFIADPSQGMLDIHGVIHHIHMEYADDTYSLSIEFMSQFCKVHFDHLTARAIILALAEIPQPEFNNPHR